MRNEAVIDGRLLKRSTLRVTPAGIPVLDFVIAHSSEQSEAGSRRKVQCDVDAVAIGELAVKIEAVKLNQPLQVTGFLARNSVGNNKLTLHANRLQSHGSAHQNQE
jgi:primosomal replication protein N